MDSVTAEAPTIVMVSGPDEVTRFHTVSTLTLHRLRSEYGVLRGFAYETLCGRTIMEPVDEVASDRQMVAYFDAQQEALRTEINRRQLRTGPVTS